MTPTTIELKGTVERIIYENIETGFFIFVIDDKTNSAIVRATIASLHPGQDIVAQGTWTVHPKFGKQFDAHACSIVIPTTLGGLHKYLSSGIIKGIGPVYAQKLIDAFGANVLEIIDKEPQRLHAIDGIGPKRAEQIIAGWREQKEVAHVMVFLHDKGISPAYAAKIYKRYKAETVAVIRENPYRLAEEVWGIGFKTADHIAHNLGFTHNCIPRIQAGLLFAISEAISNGHLYVLIDELKQAVRELLELTPPDEPLIKQALVTLYDQNKLKIISHKEQHFITTTAHYQCEYGVAHKIKTLCAYQSGLMLDINVIYQTLRVQTGPIQLNDDQQRGILAALQHKISIITGGPGTGKTTLIKQLLEILDNKKIRYKLAAPTGRAAKRMNESTHRSAVTIHRLLEFDPLTFQFKHNECNTIQTDVLIVDESSMIDIFLAHALLKATALPTHLVFIGDIDQLPPVGAGNFLRDLIASDTIACTKLSHIFRQAHNSLITINAHRVNRGEFPTANLPDAKKDFIWIKEENPEQLHGYLHSFFTKRLAQYGVDPADTMVLVPMNRGTVGTHKLNRDLQDMINPGKTNRISVGLTEFKEGDRVMQIRNNYDKMVFNGDIGFIKTIQHDEQLVSIAFGERPVEYRYSELDELVLAYAITVHKSQGSEYDAVIIPLFTQHFTLLARNLVYTAVTRAKKLCIFIGQTRALAIAIKNNKSIKRQTFLTEYLTTDLQCR